MIGRRGSRPRRLTFAVLVRHNVAVKKIRLALTTLAIAIGVLTVVAFSVVDGSLRASALALMQLGRADFTVAQQGTSDLLNSTIDQATARRVAATPGVAQVTGVLLGTTRLDADNPIFIEIGIEPQDLGAFGVSVVRGRAFGADATRELMLGWRAADNLHVHVNDRFDLDGTSFRVVGIFSTGQALGDAGAMLPLVTFQARQRQPGGLTLLFARVRAGVSVAAVRARIEDRFPQLVTIRTAQDFGRADRTLALLTAADRAGTVVAIGVGAIVVMTAMTIGFIERTREFGVLLAVGWSRARLMTMIVAEALYMGLLGAALGVGLSFAATQIVGQLPGLVGILQPVYTSGAFWRALGTAGVMSLLGGLYPAVRAARLSPMRALTDE